MLFATYPNVLIVTAVFVFGMLVGAWLLSAYIRWSEQMASLGCDDPAEPQGYVDQDGESTYYPAISWRNASVKVPHADASAATFHRGEQQ